MPNAEPDPVAAELKQLRASLDALAARVGELAAENRDLRDRLEQSQQARTDLVAQAEHLIHELAKAREPGDRPKA
ncbi:MAG: hypothetical protein KAI24_18715 [Planctomycetes bacterium]|nr:hypothetical protein [Planctomycetota bacterium]